MYASKLQAAQGANSKSGKVVLPPVVPLAVPPAVSRSRICPPHCLELTIALGACMELPGSVPGSGVVGAWVNGGGAFKDHQEIPGARCCSTPPLILVQEELVAEIAEMERLSAETGGCNLSWADE